MPSGFSLQDANREFRLFFLNNLLFFLFKTIFSVMCINMKIYDIDCTVVWLSY